MTPREYFLRLEAFQLQQANIYNQLALQAFFNQMVKSTTGSDKNPEPKYQSLDQLYNIEDEVADIRNRFEGIERKNSTEKQSPEELIVRRWDKWRANHEKRRN